MAQHTERASDILKKWKGSDRCDIACRLCGVRVVDDDPAAIWQGFKDGLGGGVRIDEHEGCDALAKRMTAPDFDAKLDAFFGSLGVEAGDYSRARRVLVGSLGYEWKLGQS